MHEKGVFPHLCAMFGQEIIVTCMQHIKYIHVLYLYIISRTGLIDGFRICKMLQAVC